MKFLPLLTLLSVTRILNGSPVAYTSQGILSGQYDTSRNGKIYETFLGIRYGHVVKRFEEAVPAGRWNGSYAATKFGPICAQMSLTNSIHIGIEDCLYVNVFTPKADNRKRPVFVYIHGGGYSVGSSLEYGGKFFMDENVVLVTFSYRLGILGFLNTDDDAVSGNNGLKDQILALKWVQENVASFGGDKNRVTVGGNSAGSSSAMLLLLSPMATGLFHGIYAQSGTPTMPWTFDSTIKPVILHIAETLGCNSTNSKQLVGCFRNTSVEELLRAQKLTPRWAFDIFRVRPAIEAGSKRHTILISKPPEDTIRAGEFPKVPVLMTMTKDEGAFTYAAPTIRDQGILNNLNANWSVLDPIVFGFGEFRHLSHRATEISRRMRQYYFAQQQIQSSQEKELTDLFTDVSFAYGIRSTAKLLGKHTKVYLALFTYKRLDDYSPVAALGVKERIEAITHCEELSYMFNPTGLSNPLPHIGELKFKKDTAFSKKFVKLLASFIKTGTPTLPFRRQLKWDPLTVTEINNDSLPFMNLGELPFVQLNPFEERTNFWRHYFGDEPRN